MKILRLTFLIVVVLMTAAITANAWYGTYDGTAIPSASDWEHKITATNDDYHTAAINDGGVTALRVVADGTSSASYYNYFSDYLADSIECCIGARFRVKYTNNTVNFGDPIISVYTKEHEGIALCVGDKDYKDGNGDRYWYTIVRFNIDSGFVMLQPIQTLPLKVPQELNPAGQPVTVQEDPSYHEAYLYVNSNFETGVAYFDGQKVWEGPLPKYSNTIGEAMFGAATVFQLTSGRNENKIFFDWVTVSDRPTGPVVDPVARTPYGVKTSGANKASLENVVISQKFDTTPDGTPQNSFYVQSKDRQAGVKVLPPADWDSSSAVPGDFVQVVGDIGDDSNQERVIFAWYIGKYIDPNSPPKPVGVSNRTSGGGPCGVQSGVYDNVPASRMSNGLTTVGLYQTIYGKVSTLFKVYGDQGIPMWQDFFYVDDGSALNDGSGSTGILCLPPPGYTNYFSYLPNLDSHVAVTGIMSIKLVNGVPVRCLLTDKWNLLN